jgi:photosystem II stability/assembly factor-like uncharacterized protein
VKAVGRNATKVGGILLSCSLVLGAWTQLDPGVAGGTYLGVHFPSGNAQVGYACGVDSAGTNLVVKTTDGGITWTPQHLCARGALRSVYFEGSDTGYAVGDNGSAISTMDGGATWTFMTNGVIDELNYISFPENGSTGFVGMRPSDGGANVLKTTDGGDVWVVFNVGSSQDHSQSCAFANDSTGIAFGDNAFVYGNHGYQDPKAPGCNMMAASYSRFDNDRAYLVGNDTALGIGIVRYTATGGFPWWDSVNCPAVDSLCCACYASAEIAYVGGAHGFIGRTSGTYQIVATDDPGVTAAVTGICFPNGPDTGYAVAGPCILKTTDAGGVAEAMAPFFARGGIKVVSNPCHGGIALGSDRSVTVTVFDAAGRAVLKRVAGKGRSFLPLRAGTYFVRAGAQTIRAVVTD